VETALQDKTRQDFKDKDHGQIWIDRTVKPILTSTAGIKSIFDRLTTGIRIKPMVSCLFFVLKHEQPNQFQHQQLGSNQYLTVFVLVFVLKKP